MKSDSNRSHALRPALILVAVCCASAPVATLAQDKAAKVSFKVTRFDPGDRDPPVYQVHGGDAKEFEVPLTAVAGPYEAELREGGFLDLWQGNTEKPAISVQIPAAMRKDLILVFIPSGKGYGVMKVHAPATKLRGGDRYIINATSTMMAVQFDGQKGLLIAPKKAGVLKGPGGANPKNLGVTIKSQLPDKKWKLMTQEFWPCDPRLRSFLFLYTSPRTKRFTIHSVTDRVGLR